MLYNLLYPLHESVSVLNVFKYITFRTFGSLITALFLYFLIGRLVIRLLQKAGLVQVVRAEGPQSHHQKKGTPTMGGLAILFTILFTSLLWSDLGNKHYWICLFVLLCYGLIGFYDDFRKIRYGSSLGLKGRYKMTLQVLFAVVVGILLFTLLDIDTRLSVPFFKNFKPDLGFFYPLFAVLVIVGASNAVNLTDGLDGLATVPLIFSFATYALFAYIVGHFQISNYLQVPYLSGTGELSVFCGAVIGACLGFLWFNTYPAEIFMGDVGSLPLGGLLGLLAILTKNEILLILVGGIFVLETISVMTQVLSFKLTGKRIFRMAPIHHHFELKGWPEAKVSVRFWIISFLLSLLAMATLKLR